MSSTSLREVTSVRSASALPPWPTIRSAVAFVPSALMSAHTTFAPSRAKIMAAARLIALPPPVMTTGLPTKTFVGLGHAHIVRAVSVDVRAHDVCALAGKDHGRGAADAAPRAGDDDRLSNEIVRGLGHRAYPCGCGE